MSDQRNELDNWGKALSNLVRSGGLTTDRSRPHISPESEDDSSWDESSTSDED